jgi:hypothetical protein
MPSPTSYTLEPHGHFVQFYEANEPLLNRNVGRFLWDGLLRGDALLVIATAERRESLSRHLGRLGADIPALGARRQLAFLDARDLLGTFMVNGSPDWHLFHAAITQALDGLHSRADDAGVCAYGEMVGVLWQAGQYDAALLVEDYWNKLLHGSGITLFCGYPIDVFAKEFHSERLRAVRCAHTHLISAGADEELHAAVYRAMDDVLGPEAGNVRVMMADRPVPDATPPGAEASILWLWENLPDAAEGILDCARQHYTEAQSPAA